jgi:hypothetical protein
VGAAARAGACIEFITNTKESTAVVVACWSFLFNLLTPYLVTFYTVKIDLIYAAPQLFD